jgi:hypothetical protein
MTVCVGWVAQPGFDSWRKQSLHHGQTSSGAYSTSQIMGTRVKRQELETDILPSFFLFITSILIFRHISGMRFIISHSSCNSFSHSSMFICITVISFSNCYSNFLLFCNVMLPCSLNANIYLLSQPCNVCPVLLEYFDMIFFMSRVFQGSSSYPRHCWCQEKLFITFSVCQLYC